MLTSVPYGFKQTLYFFALEGKYVLIYLPSRAKKYRVTIDEMHGSYQV